MKANGKILLYVVGFLLINSLFFIGDIIKFFEKRSEDLQKQTEKAFEAKFETVMIAKSVAHRGEVLSKEHIEEKKLEKKDLKKEYRLAKEVTPDFSKFVVASELM